MKIINTRHGWVQNSQGEISHFKRHDINYGAVVCIFSFIAFMGLVFSAWGWL